MRGVRGHRFDCIPFGVDGDKDRLHTLVVKRRHCLTHSQEIGGTNVWAVGIPEIDQHQTISEIGIGDCPAALIGQRKRSSN